MTALIESATLAATPVGTVGPWALALLIMVGVGAASMFLLRLVAWLTLGAWRSRAVLKRATPLPVWLRAMLPLAQPLADLWGPWLPVAARERMLRALRRAGLDDSISAQLWLALAALWCSVAAAVALLQVGHISLRAAAALTLATLPWVWLADCRRLREWEILRDLPAYVDMLTLALESGSALSTALRATTARVPDGVLRRAFLRLQGDLRAGRSRADALRAMGERMDSVAITPLVAAIIQAESSGASLSGVLRAQAEQRLDERFARAEKLALEAPVKMLAPLILCIFPCTFLVLGFPIVARIVSDWGGR